MTRQTKNSSTPTLPKLKPLSKTKNVADENVNDGNEAVTLDTLSSKLDAILQRMDALETQLDGYECENSKLKQTIVTLENRIESLESHNRRNNVILSGLSLRNVPSEGDCTYAVVDLFKNSLKYVLRVNDVVSSYRLGPKPGNQATDRRSVMLKLRETATKSDILSACKTAKPKDLYANDDLTPFKASILYALRQVKRRFPDKVGACGSRDAKVYVFMKPPNPAARHQKVFVNNLQQLNELCTRNFGIAASELMSSKPTA